MLKKLIKLVGLKLKKITRSGKKDGHTVVAEHVVDSSSSGKKAVSPDSVEHSQKRDSGGHKGRKKQWQKKNKRGSRNRQHGKKRWSLDEFQVTPEANKSRFHDFDLPLDIMHAIADLKFQYCTPIQEKSLPEGLAGNDLIGRAQTGTGKTAAFLISVFATVLSGERKNENRVAAPRALILAPTRELVMQITKDAKKIAKYTDLKIVSVFGGVDYQEQKAELENKKIDIVAATPGRLLDYLRQRVLELGEVEILVIDEADRMLDMGFIPDVRRIVHHTPEKAKRQTMMYSATITGEVRHLASQWCRKPVTVEIEPEQVTVDTVQQIVYLTTSQEKYAVLYNILTTEKPPKVMVFTNRKDEARKLTDRLKRNGVSCAMLSGDVQQKQRMSRLENFRAGKIKVLVATDVAGRGIHIDGISHVVNYTLPYEPEDYVHRIGRTGRAGAKGVSISFACDEGAFYLPDIEEYIGRKLDCQQPEESLLKAPPKGSKQPHKKYRKKKTNYRKSNRPKFKKHKVSQ